MPTLLDQLRQQQPNLQAGTETSGIQKLLSARTGKATDEEGGPKATNLQEQIQDSLNRNQQVDIAQQAQLAATQRGQEQQAIEQQFKQQNLQLSEQSVSQQEAYQRQAQAALSDFQRGIRTLDVAKQGAKVEQLGFQLRLSNQTYIMKLKDAAARDKITSAIGFSEAIQRTIFADEQDLLGRDLDFRMLLKYDDAKFTKELGQMDIDTAMAIAAGQAKDAGAAAFTSGVTQIVTAGATIAAKAPTTPTASMEVYPTIDWNSPPPSTNVPNK
jgi:hypothetical protein